MDGTAKDWGATGAQVSWSVDGGRLDAEHATVLALIDSLRQGGDSFQGDRLRVVSGRLAAELLAHFADEEALMTRYGYPQSARHIEAHDAARNWLVALEREIEAAQPSISAVTAIIHSLRGVLHREWGSEDPRLVSFLKAIMKAGPQAPAVQTPSS